MRLTAGRRPWIGGDCDKQASVQRSLTGVLSWCSQSMAASAQAGEESGTTVSSLATSANPFKDWPLLPIVAAEEERRLEIIS